MNALIRDENERRTEIGQEFLQMVQSGKIIPADTIVRMLRKIIYSGDGRTKFILTSFPDIIDQAREFERACAAISAIIYTTSEPTQENPVVEIKNNNLTLFNIDALFQKEHRLKTMSKWDDQKWQEIVGAAKIEWSAVVGLPYQGKTQLTSILAKQLGFKLVDWKQLEEEVKKSLGTEDAPFEGVPPTAKMEDAVLRVIEADRSKGIKNSYVFDSFPYHQSAADISAFTSGKLRSPHPDYLFDLRKGGVDQALSQQRYKKAKEVEADLSEEQLAEFKKIYTLAEVTTGQYVELLHESIEAGLVRHVTSLRTDATSEQTQLNILKGMLKARVILVNHEKRLSVDTTCSNLGIKYNMLYISVYQLIKQHIEENTSYGKALLATKKPREMLVLT